MVFKGILIIIFLNIWWFYVRVLLIWVNGCDFNSVRKRGVVVGSVCVSVV